MTRLQGARSRRLSPIDHHVGARLCQARRVRDLSRGELGKLVQLTAQQIQRHELGVDRIGAEMLFKFSKVLDVRVTFFFEGLMPEPLPIEGA